MLNYALLQATRRQGSEPEILVITRPPGATPPGTEDGLEPFVKIGARIFFHQRVHSKLYIREPSGRGGYSLAIVGSQNLTRSAHLELGIRICGDDRIILQLIQFFLEIMNYCSER